MALIKTFSAYRLVSALLLASSLAFVACEDSEGDVPPPTIYFANDGSFEISPNDTLTLKPKIVYDRASTYSWIVDGNVVSNELDFEFIPAAMKDYVLTFMVEGRNGSDTTNISISVVDNVDFANITNFETPKKSGNYFFPDTLSGFITGAATFYNVVNSDTTNWTGFAFSNRTDVSTTLSAKCLGCAYASAVKATDYMVVNCEGDASISFNRPYSIKTIDIASDNLCYLISRFGLLDADGNVVISNSQTNDYCRIMFYGLGKNGEVISQSSYDIVNCEYDNPAKFYRLSEWTTIPLKDLGVIYGLSFGFESSQSDFPQYFCIDNLKLQD